MVINVRTSPPIKIEVRDAAPPVIRNRDQTHVVVFQGGPITLGGSGEIDAYTHVQTVLSDLWIVNHNFGRGAYSVRVLTPGGIEMEAQVTEMSLNQVAINFASPQTGSVIVI